MTRRVGPQRRHGAGAATPRWRRALGEVVLLTLVLVLFTRLHAVVVGDVGTATANAFAVQSAERALHLDIELAANRWLTSHPALGLAAVLIYRLYYLVLIGVLVWTYVRHPQNHLRVRRCFVAMTGLALFVYWVWPVAPPRFARPGIVDIVARYDLVADPAFHDLGNGANYTAMPSLHVGWSAWCAYAVWMALRPTHPRAALLAGLFPLVMILVVITTGSHYVLDVLGSGVLLVASVAIAATWSRVVDREDR